MSATRTDHQMPDTIKSESRLGRAAMGNRGGRIQSGARAIAVYSDAEDVL